MEIKIYILRGVNKRMRGANLTRSMHWDKWKVPNPGPIAHSWNDVAQHHHM